MFPHSLAEEIEARLLQDLPGGRGGGGSTVQASRAWLQSNHVRTREQEHKEAQGGI